MCENSCLTKNWLRKSLKAPARSAIRFLKTAMAVRKDALSTPVRHLDQYSEFI